MNTIIDLNQTANVTVNQQSSYAIAFGTNAGNTSINTDAYDTHALAKQTPLNSVTNAVRDILIDVQFPSYPSAGSMSYVGPYGNIGVQRINNTTWRVFGVRDVNRYNEAFANVRVSDTGVSNAYSYTTLVQDQYGNNRSWSTAVNVRALPVLTSTGPVVFNEDSLANITQLNISANANSNGSYVLTSSTMNQSGQVSNTTASGNTVTITGNIATITTAVAAGNLKFMPRPDLAANIANALNFQLSINNNLVSQANANVQIGNTSSEYSLTTSINYIEEVTANMVSSITDVDPDPISYTVTWQQTSPAVSSYPGEFLLNYLSAGAGNALSITNSKAAINADLVQYTPPADYTGNITLTYTQTKLARDGVVYVQANAVPVTLTYVPTFYNTNTVTQIFTTVVPRINDGADTGQTYTVTFSSADGKFGNSLAYFNANTYANLASTYTFSGNMSTVDANFANIRYAPAIRNSGNVYYTYTQSRDGVEQINSVRNLIANVVPFSNSVSTFTANTTFSPTFVQATYGTANVLLVGGGGSGGFPDTSSGPGGGGAGGQAYVVSTPLIAGSTYNLEIGAGGGNGVVTGNGGNTRMLLNGNVVVGTAPSGNGLVLTTSVRGGNTGGNGVNFGNGTYAGGLGGAITGVWAGGSGITGNVSQVGHSGGGAGAAGDGAPAVTSPTRKGGNGGPGLLSNITGSNVYYAGGGAGRYGATSGSGSNWYGGGGEDTNPGQAGVIIISIT